MGSFSLLKPNNTITHKPVRPCRGHFQAPALHPEKGKGEIEVRVGLVLANRCVVTLLRVLEELILHRDSIGIIFPDKLTGESSIESNMVMLF